MTFAHLLCHPDTPAGIGGVSVEIIPSTENLMLTWHVKGAERLLLPQRTSAQRRDGLWQTTCFELFVQGADAGYREFNFSSSGAWAAYRFTGYREGMMPLDMLAPAIALEQSGERLALTVTLDASALPPMPWKIGLSAVIEETSGTKSYWALAHPPGKPDFHHPACFALQLPYPEAS